MGNELYAEWLVRNTNPKRKAICMVGMAVLIFAGIFAALISIWGMAILVLCIVGAVIISFFLKLEYEYIFISDELEITAIINQQKRRDKKKTIIEMANVELAAPMQGHELDHYLNSGKYKKVDFSSGSVNDKTYGIAVENKGEGIIYVIEPNDKILQAMRSCAPRKVILNKN